MSRSSLFLLPLLVGCEKTVFTAEMTLGAPSFLRDDFTKDFWVEDYTASYKTDLVVPTDVHSVDAGTVEVVPGELDAQLIVERGEDMVHWDEDNWMPHLPAEGDAHLEIFAYDPRIQDNLTPVPYSDGSGSQVELTIIDLDGNVYLITGEDLSAAYDEDGFHYGMNVALELDTAYQMTLDIGVPRVARAYHTVDLWMDPVQQTVTYVSDKHPTETIEVEFVETGDLALTVAIKPPKNLYELDMDSRELDQVADATEATAYVWVRVDDPNEDRRGAERIPYAYIESKLVHPATQESTEVPLYPMCTGAFHYGGNTPVPQ